MNSNFRNHLLQLTKFSTCEEQEVIQALWSGYGKISRYQLTDSLYDTVVVKYIVPDGLDAHPRGWDSDRSHNRKVKSYRVETLWYEEWNQFCTANCPTPKFIGSFSEGNQQWIILEDLNVNFPLRKQQLNLSEVKVCLKWLANFHMTFLNKNPKGLWPIGTYWHLDTRPDEFENIADHELKSKAHLMDDLLNQCQYQTIVHGDAKLANFCFSEDGRQVAAVDFQYVGGGCGMKDVAYFLGSCLSSSEYELYEKSLLDFYFSALKIAISPSRNQIDFAALEQEWRSLYPIASVDFTRFLFGWMPSHSKINAYSPRLMASVLAEL